MKLAAIYNVFDGEELLEFSINSIRKQVDLIIVVYQVISNFGDKNLQLEDYLTDLKTKKIIDTLIPYKPQLDKKPQFNEIEKRVSGALEALNEKCSHIIHMDSDELYDDLQFDSAKQYLAKNSILSSVCPIYNYSLL